MKFANKGLEKLIADQLMVVATAKMNLGILDNALLLTERGIVQDALIEKFVTIESYDLPVAEKKLSVLYRQNETALSNRVNRRNDLIGSMFTPERQIPA